MRPDTTAACSAQIRFALSDVWRRSTPRYSHLYTGGPPPPPPPSHRHTLAFIHFYGRRVRLLKRRRVCIADLAAGSSALTLGDVWLRHSARSVLVVQTRGGFSAREPGSDFHRRGVLSKAPRSFTLHPGVNLHPPSMEPHGHMITSVRVRLPCDVTTGSLAEL